MMIINQAEAVGNGGDTLAKVVANFVQITKRQQISGHAYSRMNFRPRRQNYRIFPRGPQTSTAVSFLKEG